jgi:hypothetical protein
VSASGSRDFGRPTTLDVAGDRAESAYDLWAIQQKTGRFAWRTVSRATER